MHGIPRSGHTKDVSNFFADDVESRKDYFLGLTMVFTMIMGAAAVWFLGLLILRILGHRVGCAAGRPATIPAEPMMDNGKESVNTDETGEFIVMQADQNRVNRTRIVFFISVLYAIAACGILIWSLVSVQKAFQEFYENVEVSYYFILTLPINNFGPNKYFILQCERRQELTNGFLQMPTSLKSAIEASTALETTKATLITDLGQFCGTSTESVGGLDPSGLVDDVVSSLQAIPELADDPSWNAYNSSLAEMNEILADAVSFISFLKSPTELWFICVLSAAGCIAVSTLFLLACAWKAGKEGYEFSGENESTLGGNLLHFFVIPFFALLVAATWFLSSVAFTSGAANADFCYSEIKTGDTVLNFLRQLEFNETSELYLRTDDYLHVRIGI